MRFFTILIFSVLFSSAFAQTSSDSTAAKPNKATYSAARKASILSAILPGAGQVYNRKYWKVPIIYAGLGGFGYFFYVNNGTYNNYRRALREADAGSGFAVVEGQKYSTNNLLKQKVYYRQQRDLGIIGMGVFYLLNIIDANVDAHLRTFDVSDDLSLKIKPDFRTIGNTNATCLTVQLNFK